MTTFQFSKTLTTMSGEFGMALKTFKQMLESHEICLPSGPVLAPYQRWIYEWIAYPPTVKKEDYADTELPFHWMEKCRKEFK